MTVEITWHRAFVRSLIVYALSSIAVYLPLVIVCRQSMSFECISSTGTNWDGEYYARIAEWGYTYNVGEKSDTAFFPVYPLVVRWTSILLGQPVSNAALLTSMVMCILYFTVLAKNCSVRQNQSEQANNYQVTACRQSSIIWLTLWGAAALPPSFFLRMAYSESTFAFLFATFLIMIKKDMQPLLVAVISGILTATRPIGIATALATIVYARNRRIDSRAKYAIVLTLAWFGLIVYMFAQWTAFGEPFSFWSTQQYWRTSASEGWWDKLASLGTLEPVWGTYIPGNRYYWRNAGIESPIFSIQFATPIYFVGVGVLVGIGWWTCWLDKYEVFSSIGMMAIPYFSRAYEMTFNSHARFCIVIVPAYLVLGRILLNLPRALQIAALAAAHCGLAVYSFGFALERPYY